MIIDNSTISHNQESQQLITKGDKNRSHIKMEDDDVLKTEVGEQPLNKNNNHTFSNKVCFCCSMPHTFVQQKTLNQELLGLMQRIEGEIDACQSALKDEVEKRKKYRVCFVHFLHLCSTV